MGHSTQKAPSTLVPQDRKYEHAPFFPYLSEGFIAFGSVSEEPLAAKLEQQRK